MILDVCNGLFLTPGILGQHLYVQVEDSFDDMPGEYEEKWGIEKQSMLDKINALDKCEIALIELWAVGFWAINPGQVDDYLAGKLTLGSEFETQVQALRVISERLAATKGAFKSPVIAECRVGIDGVIEKLNG